MNPTWFKYLPQRVRQQIEARPALTKALNNSGWLFFDKMVRLGIGLFVSVWVARYLGPKQFGLLSYAIAFVALFGAIAKLGLDGIVIRNLVQNPKYKENLLGTAFILKLISGVGTLLIVISAVALLRPEDLISLWLVGIIASGMIFQAFDVIDYWFQSQVESQYVVYAKCVAFLIASITKVILILNQAPLISFAYVALGEIILGSIGLVMTYQWQGSFIFNWHPTKQKAIALLKDSWPLIPAGLAIGIYMKIDQVMLGEIIGDEEVGIYSAATCVSEIWYFIPMVIISSITPALINAKKNSEIIYYQHLLKLFQLMTVIAIVITIFISLCAELIISILFGHAYSAATPILILHVWATVFVFLGVAQSPWTINEGLMKLALYRTVGGAIANVLLNLLLIPVLSGIGAAIATVISYALSGVILNIFHKKTRKIFFMQLSSMNPIKLIKK